MSSKFQLSHSCMYRSRFLVFHSIPLDQLHIAADSYQITGMSALENNPYSEFQLKEALASLTVCEGTGIKEDCSHIHGFDSGARSFFKSDHKLSMLQTITARRVLDYMELRVSKSGSIWYIKLVF
jgi:hypothetical protein